MNGFDGLNYLDIDRQMHDDIFMQSIDRKEKISRFLMETLNISESFARDDEIMTDILKQLIRESNPLIQSIEEDVMIYLDEWAADEEAFFRGDVINPVDNHFYDRKKAKAYIERYWKNYNPAYPSFSGIGGDCTNFVSQILHAGGMAWADGNTKGQYGHHGSWYCKPGATIKKGDSRITLSWKVGAVFKGHWIKRTEKHMMFTFSEVMARIDDISKMVYIGDPVQFCYANGIPWHTLAVTGFAKDAENGINDIALVSHTIDSNTRSLYKTMMQHPGDYKLRIYVIKQHE